MVAETDFSDVDWQSDWPAWDHLSTLSNFFYERSTAARTADAHRDGDVYLSLGHALSFHRKLDTPGQPFGPMLIMEGKRSAAVEDLEDGTYRAFAQIAPSIRDARVRARLADLAWTRVRDYRAGDIAVDAILECVAADANPDAWTTHVPDLERGFQLASAMGPKAGLIPRVQAVVEARLVASPSSDGYGTAKYADLLFNYGDPDRGSLTSLARARAADHFAAGEWDLARSYSELAARSLGSSNPSERQAELYRVADAYEAEANAVLATPNASQMLAAHHLQRAIESLRRAGGARPRVDTLHAQLLEVQRNSLAELGRVSHEVDLSSVVQSTHRDFEGKSLADALSSFARLHIVPSKATVRSEVERLAHSFPLSHLFPKQTLDGSGKVIARHGSTQSTDSKEREAALRSEMISHALLHLSIMVSGVIRPARAVINREHDIRLEHMLEIVHYNPLLDADREPLVAEALWAGWMGDFPKAVHLLIPQWEHAIRTLLEHRGVAVSTLDKYSLQEDRNLNRLLYEPVMIEVLGEDQLFLMQALLVEKVGADLRNRMAHGLLGYGAFFNSAAIACWWLGYRFFATPMFIALSNASAKPGQETPNPK